jgi:hypothetical protein
VQRHDQCRSVTKMGSTVSSEDVQLQVQAMVRRIAYPGSPGESVKACIVRVAKISGVSFTDVQRCWYARYKVIPAHLYLTLKAAAEAHEHRINRQIEHQRERLNRLYALVNQSSDTEFYSRAVAEAVGQSDELE